MPAAAQPSLRFFHSKALRTKTLKLLDTIEKDEEPTRRAGALADLVMELTEAGFDYFLLKPLDLVKANFVVRQTASFGMGGALRLMSPVIQTILKGMDGLQLVVICGFIRSLMK
jgi:hypothetical protein